MRQRTTQEGMQLALLANLDMHLQAAHFALVAHRAAAVVAGHQCGRWHPSKVLMIQQKCRYLPDCALTRAHTLAKTLLQTPKPSLHTQQIVSVRDIRDRMPPDMF